MSYLWIFLIPALTSCDYIPDRRKSIDLVCTGITSDGKQIKQTFTFRPEKLSSSEKRFNGDPDWSLTIDANKTIPPENFNYQNSKSELTYEFKSSGARVTDDLIFWTLLDAEKSFFLELNGNKVFYPRRTKSHYIKINRISGDYQEDLMTTTQGVGPSTPENDKYFSITGSCVPASRF